MSDGKHTIVTVDGTSLDLGDPEPRMSERLPPGDSLSWIKEGDTVTMEDQYGYTAHASITQVVAPEGGETGEGRTKETQHEKDLREAEEWIETLPISPVSPEASWATEAWMRARGHISSLDPEETHNEESDHDQNDPQ